ncbi:MAG TPA: VWA domain-containing protein, partial [Telluria sp.]|nr:VWA domain-containing protein [Telluria sp.]
MTIKLEEHADLLEELGEHASSMLHASWHEAARVFSPKGLEGYLIGAQRLKGLGKGQELVTTFIQSAPEIAREIGEDAVIELVQTAMMMASKTSGSVLEMVVGTAPTAAKRLGDEALFRGYLQLLNVLLAQAPRGLRPMLGKLETLFANLTLGGLRRWANWGAHAHRTNYEEQVRYFGLESKESQAMLQKERKGTLFIDVQRRINMYLRALWARDFFMRPTSGDFENREGYKPYIEDYLLHLPDAFDSFEDVAGLEIYRAAAAHCAAHLVYTREPLSAEGLNTLQMAVIGIVEDARVETLAIRKFPGLKGLWASLFKHVTPAQKESAGDYFNRLARALLDDSYVDDDTWIAQGRSLFKAAEDKLDSNLVSWEIGVQLTHFLQEKKLGYSPRRDVLTTPYRDDNRYFWQFVEFDQARAEAAGYDQVQQVRKYVNVMEMANEIDTELAGDDAQEIWVLGSELFPYEDLGVSFNDMEGKEPISEPFHYSEWDYQIQLERPAWATVLERRP